MSDTIRVVPPNDHCPKWYVWNILDNQGVFLSTKDQVELMLSWIGLKLEEEIIVNIK